MIKNFQNTFFLTATIKDWKHILKKDNYKDIILSSFQFLVKSQRVKIFGFVITPNHVHLILYKNEGQLKNSTQGSLLRFSAQQIKFDIQKNNPIFLKEFKVNSKDRAYQIWKRNPLSIEIFTENVFEQKLNYIHLNPLSKNWHLADTPEEYYYSSAKFYENGIDNFGFLTNGYLV